MHHISAPICTHTSVRKNTCNTPKFLSYVLTILFLDSWTYFPPDSHHGAKTIDNVWKWPPTTWLQMWQYASCHIKGKSVKRVKWECKRETESLWEKKKEMLRMTISTEQGSENRWQEMESSDVMSNSLKGERMRGEKSSNEPAYVQVYDNSKERHDDFIPSSLQVDKMDRQKKGSAGEISLWDNKAKPDPDVWK